MLYKILPIRTCISRECEITKCKLEKLKDQHALLERGFVDLQMENMDLVSNQEENKAVETSDADFNFLSVVKNGTRYSPEIRKLYYTLLADQVPASKVASII